MKPDSTPGSADAAAADRDLAERVVRGMLERDAFARWLGITPLEIAPRRSVLQMVVRDDMVNGFGVAHGGIAFSLADTALAFACNSDGTITVAIENNIGYPARINVGDTITATAAEESTTNRLKFYRVTVANQRAETVATFRGTVYRTNARHDVEHAR